MAKRGRSRFPLPDLPIHIIEQEILVRLPAKPLLRCRCVSRSWCAMIDEPSFAAAHFKLCQTNQNKSRFLVLEPPDIVESKQICAIRNIEKFRKVAKVDIGVTLSEHYQAVGYINGVLCMKRYVNETRVSRIFLWNPSIRKAVRVPFNHVTNDVGVRFDVDYAFGYDPVRNDYKIVASFFIGNRVHVPGSAEIFTLSTMSWKPVTFNWSPCLWVKDGRKVFLNGVTYWEGVDAMNVAVKGRCTHFVSFDVATDEFRYIRLPRSQNNILWVHERFPIVLDQSVGMMEAFDHYSQVWILDPVAQSWSIRFKIDLYGLLRKCLYFRSNGELLFFGEKGSVKSYNIKKGGEPKVLAKSYKMSPILTSVYMESLALLSEVPEGNLESFPSPEVAQP